MGSLLKARRRGKMHIRGTGYRLQYRLATRVLWTALLLAAVLFFGPIVLSGAFELWWRVVAAGLVACSVIGVRVLWGPAVVVAPGGMRIYRPWWPLRRDIAWHRMLATDIIPGFWFLEIEMNSGERIELPCVERMDALYEQIEQYRARLDIV
jgi:hypothetical protein